MSNYSKKLFNEYYELHGKQIDSDIKNHVEWFGGYYKINYKEIFSKFTKNSQILEIGCNKGLLLKILSENDFINLHGVDLSVEDIKTAKELNPNINNIFCIDAVDYLKEKDSFFDVVILKAVLEHIKKDEIMPFLLNIKKSLKDGGIIIIDVPNMDWLFAGHERYMDFTHEVGFTRESLSQVLRSVFNNADVNFGLEYNNKSIKSKIKFILKPILIRMINFIFKFVGDGGADTWWFARSIIATAKK